MFLTIAAIAVLVLIAIAVLPQRKRDTQGEPGIKQSTGLFQSPPTPLSVSLREQQLKEESEAIATEFRKCANDVWLAEVREKAASLLGPPK